jgi:hypothetical protein
MAKNLTFLIIVLVVLAAIFLISRRGGEDDQEMDPLFPGFEAEAAGKIVINGKSSQTVLEKMNGIWVVTSEDTFPADADAMESMFRQIGSFVSGDIVSSNPDKRSIYQVDTTGTAVVVEGAGGGLVASFVVGKAGPDYQSTYVRREDSDNVVLASGYLQSVFERGSRTWQDTRVFKLDPESIEQVYLVRPDETIGLKRDAAGEWYISQPESAASDQNMVSRLVRTIAGLRAEEFAGRAPVKDSGLAEADSSLRFMLTGGSAQELAFGSSTEQNRTYCRPDDSDIVYLIGSYKVKSLLPRLQELRKKEDLEGED